MDESRERILGTEGIWAAERFSRLSGVYGERAVFKYIEAMTNGVAGEVVSAWLYGMKVPSTGIQKSVVNALKNYREGDLEAMGYVKMVLSKAPEAVQKDKGPGEAADVPAAESQPEEAEPGTEKLYVGLSADEAKIFNGLKQRFKGQFFEIEESGYSAQIVKRLYRARYLTREKKGTKTLYRTLNY